VAAAVEFPTCVATVAAAVAPPAFTSSVSRVTVVVSLAPTEIDEWPNVIRASQYSSATLLSGADPDPDG
jgi:hypothetical protein